MIYGNKFKFFGKENELTKIKYKDISKDCPVILAIANIESYEDFDAGEDPTVFFKFNKLDEENIKKYKDFIKDNKNKLSEIKKELADNLNGKSYNDSMIDSVEISVTNKNIKKIISELNKNISSYKHELDKYNKNLAADEKSLKYITSKYASDAKKIVDNDSLIKLYITYYTDFLNFEIKLYNAAIYGFSTSIESSENVQKILDKINEK